MSSLQPTLAVPFLLYMISCKPTSYGRHCRQVFIYSQTSCQSDFQLVCLKPQQMVVRAEAQSLLTTPFGNYWQQE
ncbi:hypothetical protein F5Y18DRAFT_408391 [Xylariaceae sp. FL1019]|nr:hypothetical protein F5Y18DRAFT_408391 [Xylariaceae sp. FL1019]